MESDAKRSLNLFLSYCHEEPTKSLVTEVNKFFVKRQHKVWMDEELIRKGADWRREIIEGIDKSNNVMAFLTERAIGRKYGVCLDEIRISVSIPGMNVISVLLEDEKDLNIPCTISRNQYIDMSDWKQFWNTPQWKQYFDEKMLSLAEWLESEEHFQFQGEITTVNNMLLPDISDIKYYSLLEKKTIGREWLSDEFDKWLMEDEKVLMIKGGPGSGKSHFSANKSHYNPDIIATYFCEFDKIGDDIAKKFIRSICFQIATKFPEFRYWIINANNILDKNDFTKNIAYFNENTPEELFEQLIVRPLDKSINGMTGNKCILIDGVDEATCENNNTLVNMLINKMNSTPKWIKFAITSRDEEEVVNAFGGCYSVSLENEKSKEDIVRYVTERLKDKVDSSIINKIAQKSEHMFIFAEKYCDAYLNGLIDQDNIPDNIGGLYYHYFKRLFATEKYSDFRKAISVITSYDLCELTEETFKQIMDYDYEKCHKFLSTLKSFLSVEQNGSKRNIRFYHKSIKDWLTNVKQSGIFYIDVLEGRKIICDFSENVIKNPNGYEYEILKSSYIYIKKYGSTEQKNLLSKSYPFLIKLQKLAYGYTDIPVFRDVCIIFDSISDSNINDDVEIYCAKAYSLECQFEVDRDNKALAQKKLITGRKKYKKALKKDFCLYAEMEENLLWSQENSAKKGRRLLSLIKKAEKKANENRHQILSNLYFSYSTFLYNNEDYEEALLFLDKTLNNAAYIVDDKARKNTIFRAYNQKGACFSRQKKDSLAIECYENSLKLRQEICGKYSHYTAIGYDALARGHIYKAENEGSPLDCEVEMFAQTALKINNTLFGKYNKMSARNLHTLAMIYRINKEYKKAFEYATKSQTIYENYKVVSAIDTLKKFISELQPFL